MESFLYPLTAMKQPMQKFSLLNYHPFLFLENLYSSTVPMRVCNEAHGNYSSQGNLLSCSKGATAELRIQKRISDAYEHNL